MAQSKHLMEEIPYSPLADSRPRIIPVMDVRGGIVVRAIAGRREEYKPLVSRLTNSTDPLAVAETLRVVAATDKIYVADLDAVAGAPPRLDLFRALQRRGFHVWADPGLRLSHEVEQLYQAGVDVVIAGLETLHGPDVLREIIRDWERFVVAFSLDLKNGMPATDHRSWSTEPKEIIAACASVGLLQLIVLDLAFVGTGHGVGSLELLLWAKAKYPHLELIAGGGIRGPEDLPPLYAAGVSAVLVASALHDGHFGLPAAPM